MRTDPAYGRTADARRYIFYGLFCLKEKSNLWKIYFWLSCALIISGIIITFITDPQSFTLLDIIDILIGIVAFVGFYGFVYSKRIYIESIWKHVFFFSLTWEISYSIIYLNFFQETTIQNTKNLIALIITYAYAAPMFFALYIYGFSSSHLWDKH